MIEVEGLRKTYRGSAAVDGISFHVARGEIFGLLGPNGAGKTTTVECLQALRSADSGHLRVLGLDPRTQSAELRRRMGSQLQESALPDRIRVWEVLDLFSAPSGRDWRPLLDDWGLGSKRSSSYASLSGGQRQRLLVALALVNQPEVVFLDEMTTGLDPTARRVAWDLIEAIRQRGTTVVLVTHFMDEAERLCDRLAILNHGRIVAVDTPRGLVTRYGRSIRIVFDIGPLDSSWLEGVPHVSSVCRRGSQVEVEGTGPVLTHVAAALLDHGIEAPDLHVERESLEDVFLKLTRGDDER